jgi:hypothetical protein
MMVKKAFFAGKILAQPFRLWWQSGTIAGTHLAMQSDQNFYLLQMSVDKDAIFWPQDL